MKKKLLSIFLIVGLLFSMVACGQKDEPIVSNTTPPIEEPEPSIEPSPEENLHIGQVQSKVNGQWISEELGEQRPLAIMMGNTNTAAPQSGISKASVVYEIPVEGGITRLMSIIEDYQSLDKIGSARSCRYYFVHYAMEYDALYAHFGQSKYAKKTLAEKGVDNINGLEYKSGRVYYRTKDRKAPHNAYADGKKVYEYASSTANYRTTYQDSQPNHFQFASEEKPNTLTNGSDANYVRPGYPIDDPWYEYHPDDGLYYRFQYNDKHMDKETKEQLTCKNIIIQFVSISYFDDKYSLIIDTTEGGNGFYITEGKSIPITWEKSSKFDITHYYDENGYEIMLNPGVTWVLLANKTKQSNVIIAKEK